MFSESAEFYDAIYSFKDYGAEAADLAARVRKLHAGAYRLLDVACGTGEHARLLAERHGFQVDGLDLDAGLLDVARKKHPAGRFFCADMSDFDLDDRYDGILCLFSSIGYLVTLDRARLALACFGRHLAAGGIVLVEPWFAPGRLANGNTSTQTGSWQGRTVERTSRVEILERVSRLHFDYRVDTVEGVRHLSEVHDLGLFTPDEMAAAFETAGLRAEFDPVGPTGRGLWTARA